MADLQYQTNHSNQTLFVGSIIVLSILFAAGFSVALFGATTPYLATPTDGLLTAALGVSMMIAGGGGVYLLLR
jgi:small neutral amino acid transporter SnatA (MarC family)